MAAGTRSNDQGGAHSRESGQPGADPSRTRGEREDMHMGAGIVRVSGHGSPLLPVQRSNRTQHGARGRREVVEGRAGRLADLPEVVALLHDEREEAHGVPTSDGGPDRGEATRYTGDPSG